MPSAMSLPERLLARSVVADTGCRRWTGAHIPDGYGHISINGKARRVHIVAHEVWTGPVPDGCEIDHVYANGCRYLDCIEPSHLEAVTHAENYRRFTERITHCPKGHEYTPDNILWDAPRPEKRSITPSRRCRRCKNDRRIAYRARLKADRDQLRELLDRAAMPGQAEAGGAERPLTRRQKTALLIADGYGITRSISGSLPSLERRGLAEKYWETTNGRRWRNWRVTEAGHAEAERLRAETRQAEAETS